MSISRLNQCEPQERRRRYAQLIPPRIWDYLLTVDKARFEGGWENPNTFHVFSSPGRAECHIRVPAQRYNHDYCLSMDLDEAGGGQLELGFIVINDVTKPRFNIDVDDYGQVTLLGTAERNIGEELRALAAGLGPCQVRHGLRLFSDLLPRLEAFGQSLGYVALQLQPLTYHNAIMYEKYGFNYITGRRRMRQINEEFQPGGELAALLHYQSPFRVPEFAATPRGRSWAIHDGILEDFDGQEQFDMHMVKAFGQAGTESTFSYPSAY